MSHILTKSPLWSAGSALLGMHVALAFGGEARDAFAGAHGNDTVAVRSDAGYAVTHWGMADGLPLDKVRALAQTPDGFLWAGTFNGLARFDGVRFQIFSAGQSGPLQNNAIESLCVDARGRLWIGDNRGAVTVCHAGKFEAMPLPREWPGKPVLRILAARGGAVWAMNEEGGALVFQDGSAPRYFKLNSNPSLFALDGNGEARVAHGGRLCGMDEARGAVPLDGAPDFEGRCQAVFAARAGGVWILCNDRLRRWDGGRWVEDRGKKNWRTFLLAAFAEGADGRIFGGSFKDGLSILHADGRMERIDENNGLANNWTYCLMEDREGNVWVGTGNGGLHSLTKRRVTMIDTPDHWRRSAVLSIARRSAGGLWVGTEGGGVYCLDGERITHLPLGEPIWQSVVNCVFEDSRGRLWVGTWNSGLGHVENGAFKFAWPPNRQHRVVLAVFESSNGDIWAGSLGGTGRLRNGNWEWFEHAAGLNGMASRCFAEQRDGSVWCGLDDGGVRRIAPDGSVQAFRTTDGLAGDKVRSLHVDEDDVVWVGTRSGLSRIKRGHIAKITTSHGLPANEICQILDDHGGHLWLGSFRGLLKIEKKELNRCADGQQDWVSVLVCDKASGLGTLEVSEQGQPSACRTEDGWLWFATGKGIALVKPGEVRRNLIPPRIYIEDVLLDGRGLSQGKGSVNGEGHRLSVPPGGGRLEFCYTGVSLTNPAQVEFRYRIKEIDATWTEAGTRRTALYPWLPPGNYTFQVEARNADGIRSPAPASVSVEVLPYFWQTGLFSVFAWLGSLCVITALIAGVARRRARKKLEVIERRHALEQERGRIARDIHDDLGAGLTRIVMLSESAWETSPDSITRIKNHAVEINQTARELTLKAGEIVWAVNPEHDTLESLAGYLGKYAHDFFSGSGIRCRLDIPMALPKIDLTSQLRHNLFLSFKEALNNVLKHSGASLVRVSMSLEPARIVIDVADDGRGFDSEAARFSGGNGLRNMRRRLAAIEGSLEIEAAVNAGCRLRFVVSRGTNIEGRYA